MSCSRTQHGGGRSRTPDLSLRSPTLYHWATALPKKKKGCNHPKIWTKWFYCTEMHKKDIDGLANSEDADQNGPRGAISSGSILFIQSCLSENLGTLWYYMNRFCSHIPYHRHPCVFFDDQLCSTWAKSWENLFCHMRTIKTQISLRILAVWSASLLFTA